MYIPCTVSIVQIYLQEPVAQDTAPGVPNIPHKLLQTGHQRGELICVRYVLQRLWWSKRDLATVMGSSAYCSLTDYH